MIELLLSVIEEPNQIHKYCMSKHEHWTGRAACVQELRHAQRKMEVEELRQFLKDNGIECIPTESNGMEDLMQNLPDLDTIPVSEL